MTFESVKWFAKEFLLPLLLVVLVLFAIFMFALGMKKMFPESVPGDFEKAGIKRYIDDEAGVVCFTAYRALSCLPLGDTRLGEDDGR